LEAPEIAVARYAAQISLWALYVSGGALFISACVFALELRRWFEEGVKLSVSIMADAKIFGGGRVDANTYLSATVTNRGSAPTTLTHMLLYNYQNQLASLVPDRIFWMLNRLSRRLPDRVISWFGKLRPETAVVNSIGAPGPIPFVLQPGHTWVGTAIQTPELEEWISKGGLFVGIVGSHSDRTLFKRVRHWKLPKDTKTIEPPHRPEI
jgi:hypothetical protein